MNIDGQRETSAERLADRGDELLEEPVFELPRLGQDVRFVLACVGGGAIRIGREIAHHHLRYVESVAINCDPRVQDLEEFDRRVCLGSGRGDGTEVEGSPAHGAHIARAALPALERIFEGSTFVTVVASLGGGSGTGALPYVLDAAARASQVLSVFAVKPFQIEGERRAVADRALARLHFVESYVEKLERGSASLQVLDNEAARSRIGGHPLVQLNRGWADQISAHIERSYIAPAEAILEAHRSQAVIGSFAPEPLRTPPPIGPEHPRAPLAPQMSWESGPATPDAELTFEIGRRPEGPSL